MRVRGRWCCLCHLPSSAHHWVHQCRPVRKDRHCTEQTVLPLSNQRSPAVCVSAGPHTQIHMITVGILSEVSSNEISQCQLCCMSRLNNSHMDACSAALSPFAQVMEFTRINTTMRPGRTGVGLGRRKFPEASVFDGQRVKLLHSCSPLSCSLRSLKARSMDNVAAHRR